MPVELYDLPFDMLEMIGKSYDDLAQRDATATLQATLKRHVVTRCDNPRHTARTNTPGEGPVLCYKSCHDRWAKRSLVLLQGKLNSLLLGAHMDRSCPLCLLLCRVSQDAVVHLRAGIDKL